MQVGEGSAAVPIKKKSPPGIPNPTPTYPFQVVSATRHDEKLVSAKIGRSC